MSLKLLIVGYGKMGRMVEEMTAGQDIEIVGRVDEGRDEWAPADVAVDFTTARALLANFPHYIQRRMSVVIGTTGWGEHTAKLRADAAQAGLGVVTAPNFSRGSCRHSRSTGRGCTRFTTAPRSMRRRGRRSSCGMP
jgi:4-hydroxy-tetrahydrodipicolinate reductase